MEFDKYFEFYEKSVAIVIDKHALHFATTRPQRPTQEQFSE